ncbi:uncharacterized protein DSM5745_02280 [Aspergillus mulundensis]|uniref:Uncharacterized protein n=1 Tax=Aspergillus mulundensis TaxID=1810919 RepID=A0A3D8SW34_9EURO|nr:hypothetical protein DSM5745_02280 [Aspergillus mulundensis]RDW90505.1 hypothetical protein DSM5745_02280 [Aspergillus mulundensis]
MVRPLGSSEEHLTTFASFICNLAKVPDEDRPTIFAEAAPIHEILENLSHIPPLPQCNIVSKPQVDMNRMIETPYIRKVIAGDLRTALNEFYASGGAVMKVVQILYQEHNSRYNRLCPLVTQDEDPGHHARYVNHCESIEQLRAWTPRFPPGEEYLTIPNQKLPKGLMAIHIDMHAYEEWASKYNDTMNQLLNGPWVAYQDAKVNFEKALNDAAANGTLPTARAVGRVRTHWQGYLEEMHKWEKEIPRLGLSSFVTTVIQVFVALIERAEDGWVLSARFLASAPRELRVYWWRRLLAGRGVVNVAAMKDILPANCREESFLGG